MDHQLKEDKTLLPDILKQTTRIAENFFARQGTVPAGRHIPARSFRPLPEEGVGALGALEFFEKNYADKVNGSSGPRYFGFVVGGSTPASVAGDWLVSTFDQNVCGSEDSIAPHIENETIHFFKSLFGLDHGWSGAFVTGATMSNFVSLSLARQWVGARLGTDVSAEGLAGVKCTLVSGSPHASVYKSVSMLGMGRQSIHTVGTLPGREAMDVRQLENYLDQHPGPHIVVANAGTVNTGDFDDLEAIGRLRTKYDFWMHVDAAFGGFAACSEKYAHLIAGLHYADSLTVDAHKWLNVPYDAAMQFTRHKKLQLEVYQNSAAYLGDPSESPDFFHYTPENSRRWRALPSWFSLLAYGKAGHREIVERNCALAYRLGALIETSARFRLLSAVTLNIVCFTLREDSTTARVKRFLTAVRDDGNVFFTPTQLHGVPAIRAAISNWQTEAGDIEIAFRAMTAVADALAAEESSELKEKTF